MRQCQCCQGAGETALYGLQIPPPSSGIIYHPNQDTSESERGLTINNYARIMGIERYSAEKTGTIQPLPTFTHILISTLISLYNYSSGTYPVVSCHWYLCRNVPSSCNVLSLFLTTILYFLNKIYFPYSFLSESYPDSSISINFLFFYTISIPYTSLMLLLGTWCAFCNPFMKNWEFLFILFFFFLEGI